MAKKEKKSPLAEARDALKRAQAEYGKLIKKATGKMTNDELAGHTKKCRQALEDKRYAAGVVEALALGRTPPERETIIEANR